MPKELIAQATIDIAAPSEKVWLALVTPEIIARYMFGARVVSDWKQGSPITWQGEWQGTRYEDHGVILELNPGRLIRYSHFSPLSGLPDRPENYHIVTVELEPTGSSTRLRLSQDNNADEDERRHSEQNWQTMLARMKLELERKP